MHNLLVLTYKQLIPLPDVFSLMDEEVSIIYGFRGRNKNEAKRMFCSKLSEPHEKEHLEHNKIIYFVNVWLLFFYTTDWTQHEISKI